MSSSTFSSSTRVQIPLAFFSLSLTQWHSYRITYCIQRSEPITFIVPEWYWRRKATFFIWNAKSVWWMQLTISFCCPLQKLSYYPDMQTHTFSSCSPSKLKLAWVPCLLTSNTYVFHLFMLYFDTRIASIGFQSSHPHCLLE